MEEPSVALKECREKRKEKDSTGESYIPQLLCILKFQLLSSVVAISHSVLQSGMTLVLPIPIPALPTSYPRKLWTRKAVRCVL